MLSAWWNPARCWFAEPAGAYAQPQPIGMVTRALRGKGPAAVAVAHWLAVSPEWRRRGVAGLLMSALETACWDDGFREVRLETLSSWTSAVAFYKSRGYTALGAKGA